MPEQSDSTNSQYSIVNSQSRHPLLQENTSDFYEQRFSSIFTGLNFIVTVHKLRPPGMTWFRLPLFVWAQYATSIIILLGTPVVAITILMVGAERMFHLGIFDPAYGGDPILFQHLFWFYSHPAVYIMILPAMGMVSDIIACFARKPIFGYKPMVFSIAGIAGLGFDNDPLEILLIQMVI